MFFKPQPILAGGMAAGGKAGAIITNGDTEPVVVSFRLALSQAGVRSFRKPGSMHVHVAPLGLRFRVESMKILNLLRSCCILLAVVS